MAEGHNSLQVSSKGPGLCKVLGKLSRELGKTPEILQVIMLAQDHDVPYPTIATNDTAEGHNNLQFSSKEPQLYGDWRSSHGNLAKHLRFFR